MSNRSTLLLRIAAFPVIWCLVGSPPLATAAESAPPSGGTGGAPATTSRALTLDAYAEMRKAAEEAFQTPEGPERIAKCEAFLKAHPDYPDLRDVLSILIEDSLKTGNFDPAGIAARMEKLVSLSADSGILLEDPESFIGYPAYLVQRYYFRYGLPLDSAQRLIDVGWKRHARVRGERKGKRLHGTSRQEALFGTYEQMRDAALDESESVLRLGEARVKLARGDPAGALQVLQAHGEVKSRYESRLLLRARADGKVSALSLPGDDWYELTLARAYAALEKQAQAMEHLERVMAFGEIQPDLKDAVARLRSELGRPAPGGLEFRGEPVKAPELALKDLDGGDSRLSDYRGRVVLLVFWTTW